MSATEPASAAAASPADAPATAGATGPAPRVVVLDHGSGNVRSVVRALEAAGAEVELIADRGRALAADGLVVPGVGAYSATLAQILAVGGDRIIERRLAGGLPVLGICVGLQAMFEAGTEHGERTRGLGQWPGEVTHLQGEVVPHMGWNTVEPAAGSALFAGIEQERFYFVHSYAATEPPPNAAVTTARHGSDFIAAVEDGTTWAAQFHPEKSAAAGAQLLRNWLASFSADSSPGSGSGSTGSSGTNPTDSLSS